MFESTLSEELITRLSREHVPFDRPVPGHNKPAVDVPLQCRACLQKWKCATRVLLDQIAELSNAVVVEPD